MNKSDLTNQLSLDEKSLDTILEAVGIAKNLPEYSDEQLKMIQTLQDIRKDSKVKSWTEAAVIYRKPLHEHQLQEIALRYSQTERIAEIVAALKLKLGTMNEEQFAAFQSVCEQVQQGMDLGMVAHAVLEQAKASKSKKATAQPAFAPQLEPTTAIAVAQTGAMANVPEQYRASAAKAADNLAQIATAGLSERTMDAAEASVVKGWEVIPKAISANIEDAMLTHVQSEQFAIDTVEGVKERLRKRGLLQ